MNDLNQRKVELINIRMTNSTIAIITIIVFILLTYNQKLSLTGQKTFIDPNKVTDIITVNRLIILAVLSTSVYLNYKSYKISKEMDSEVVSHVAHMEYLASYLPLLEIIILVYLSFRYFNDIEIDDIGPIVI